MIHFSVQESQHLLCEVLRNDQCRIVITVLNSFQGFFGSPREYPPDGGIGPQSLQHTVSYIQGKSHDLRSGIIGSHRHLQLTGSCRFIGIPVGENIEPCIQCRENTQSHNNNNCHHIIADPTDVGGKYFPDVTHITRLPPRLLFLVFLLFLLFLLLRLFSLSPLPVSPPGSSVPHRSFPGSCG